MTTEAIGLPRSRFGMGTAAERRWLARTIIVRVVVAAAVVVIVGNVAILAISAYAQWRWAPQSVPVHVDGVSKLSMVDDAVWRGAAPGLAGYESLAAAGVGTVVDLRAESDASLLDPAVRGLGLDIVRLPIRDGQTPTADQVARFADIVRDAPGIVFVHCGAGVGRTGAMAAAYLVASGQASGRDAMLLNLAVGPPSLEQLVFARGLEGSDLDRPHAVVAAFSRFLDAPRRMWSRWG